MPMRNAWRRRSVTLSPGGSRNPALCRTEMECSAFIFNDYGDSGLIFPCAGFPTNGGIARFSLVRIDALPPSPSLRTEMPASDTAAKPERLSKPSTCHLRYATDATQAMLIKFLVSLNLPPLDQI